MTAIDFLSWLRPGAPRLLTAIVPDGKTTSLWCEADLQVASFIKRHDGEKNVYYALNPTKGPISKKASKADIARAEFLHADCDPEDDETPDQAKARYLALAENFQPRPSAAIDSGNGIQLLWRLAEPLADPLEAESYNKALMQAFGTKAGTQNVDRILRLPGTINLPNEKKRSIGRVRCATRIIWLEDTAYGIEQFAKALGEPEKPKLNGKAHPSLGGVSATPPKDALTVDALPITDDLKKVIREGCYEKWDGDRSRAVWHATRELLRQGIEAPAIERILLDNEIGAHVRAQTSPSRALSRTVARARDSIEDFVRGDEDKIAPGVVQNVRRAVAELGIALSYDEFADRVLVSGLDGFGPALDDHAVDRIWLLIDERFRFRPKKDFMRTVIIDDARTRFRFHPVREYLDGLKWDGEPRIDRWLIEYGGAPESEYVRAVGAIALLAAVRRVRDPGCKFDELLVLEDPTQGSGKSTALAALAVQEDWFTDCLPLDRDPKVIIEQTRGKWICEAGELSGMRRGDIDKLKGLLSRQRDRARLAYGHLAEEVARQWIAIGTTNSREYLKDQTGNRRFWPIAIAGFDVAALRADRDQLWAEAAAREAAGESIRLDPALWQAAGIEQEERTISDPFFDALSHCLGEYEDARIAAADVWKLLGNTPVAQRTQDKNERMGSAMRRLGFERKQVRAGGPSVKGYRKGEGQHLIEVHVTRGEDGQTQTIISIDGEEKV